MSGALPPGVTGEAVERAVVYLRTVAPGGVSERQRRALAALRVAAREGRLETVEADRWEHAPSTAELAPDDASVSELLVRFQRWAAREDRSVAHAFDGLGSVDAGSVSASGNGEAESASASGSGEDAESDEGAASVAVHSSGGGEARSVVGLPLLCVALFDADDRLLAVYPHADGDTVHDVEDCIEALAAPWIAAGVEQ